MVTETGKPAEARKRPVDPARKYWWSTAIAVPIVVAVATAVIGKWPFGEHDASPVPGATYIGSMTVIGSQYQQFLGQPLTDAELRHKIEEAVALTSKGDFPAAIAAFDRIPEAARVPALWNDLGVAYLGAKDQERARAAFERARQADPQDAAAKANLSNLAAAAAPPASQPQTPPQTAAQAQPAPQPAPQPVSAAAVGDREVEPNNDFFHVNDMALGTTVQAAIADGADADYFAFTTPGDRRDMIDITLENDSTGLQPDVYLYDGDRNKIAETPNYNSAGNLRSAFAAAPDSRFYVAVASLHGTAGAYRLTVKARRAYDAYEPNDDIFHATPIEVGKAIEAEIMDSGDADYYRFKTDKAGNLLVSLDNRSTSLQPDLLVFGPDRSRIGEAGNYTSSGNVSYALAVAANSTYYVEIGNLHGTAGAYTLSLAPQP